MSGNCLFCQIVNKKIPTEFLYEDENVVVFKDIHPAAPVHLLIVPKKHIRSINDLQKEESLIISELFMIAKDMAKKQGVNESGYKLLFNVEKGGGQVIFHLHLHLIGGWNK
ncbi:MAG: histidine triad nucleotide-binding protein [Desulfobacula sp.]|jgi:histidine triad (HIT) family protein|uniref:histidine triad nucleotide-binding protein n=1 Tax=Desulfobacula sp. TaxID=2593537 RepID=UPI001D3C72D9|nr:histidine triad nucleotide-binding protein [Desulfobacula sp.]MBT3485356.1 histidine triad nucleotide-binding protein [Desulfobacula sp.]MBT3803792.1 histidine triad nucleotide-binding protein [Desulfobacula sp.]MBT4026626.1 histidine triad nucleotide-binding protein [Desulfobacula sp.]MBT4200537.1 histidine triad nucleotide-binding protein [Desulfobacula sp.]